MSGPFPENQISVIRDYVGATGADPAGQIEVIRAALLSVLSGGQGIQEHNPFPPHNLINQAAEMYRARPAVC
jgi:hypothetical protein